jgi:RNA polymerase sigma-70 factor (ECF subfamily)
MSTEGDDRALLARHLDGDPDAFGELARRHRDRLWRIAIRTLGNAEDAADAVQDGLLAALRGAHGYRGEAAVSTWLHRIVVNACLDLARQRGRRPTTELPEDLPAVGRSPYDDVDTSVVLRQGLALLPVEQAAAVVLVDVEGFSVHDAAELLEIAEGTVKSRCARGRRRLADLLTDRPGTQAGNQARALPVQPPEPAAEKPDAPPAATDGGERT